MTDTPRLGLKEWLAGIQQAQQPANDNAQALDAYFGGAILSRTTTAQPVDPADGETYIIPAGATGSAWSTFAQDSLAYARGGAWYEYPPLVGLRVWVVDATENRQWNGTDWIAFAADGDVSGPTSSTDNTLPRFDGTGGKTLQTSGVVVEDDNGIHGYRAKVVRITGTSHTFQAADTGKVHVFENAGATTATVPSSLLEGWAGSWLVKGAGQVTFAVTDGTLHNRQSHTKSAGQKAMGTLVVESNAGSAPQVYLAGDTAA